MLKYKDELIEQGLDNFKMVRGLDDEDIDEVIPSSMKNLHKKILRRAMKETKDGKYPPKSAEEEKFRNVQHI